MRAWLLDHPGPPASLRQADVDSPWRSPVAGRREVEVLVQVEAVGLNPVDIKSAAAGHPAWHYPHVLGLDVAGRVVAVHADAVARREQSWMLPKPGTRVVFHQDLREPGGFAELVAVPPEALAPVPPEIDPIAAARPENEEMVRALGALYVVDYRAPDLAEQVRRIAPGGVDAVIDTVSARSATESLGLLKHAGHLVAVAGRPDLAGIPEFGLAPTVSEVALGAAYTHGGFAGRRWLTWGLERLMRLIIEGHLHPPDIEVIGFDEIPRGLDRLARREVDGKLVANLRWS